MTVLIPLHNGMHAVVDDEDSALRYFNWTASSSPKKGGELNWYAKAHGRYMHRMIAEARPDQEVDHVDGDGLNNRRSNLRICTSSQNAMNIKQREQGFSPYRGVEVDRRCRKPFRAVIQCGRKRIRLGSFEDATEAALIRDAAALEMHGEFARLNFPRPGERGLG